ncbi:spindle pole body component 110 isoform X2 [Arachis duranensis]|uniref:Spindle pole body component 110 isoform X2 n=1 Tax=Arachis duranensis TaxID=130453 RepID=A0A9C6TDJ1_ARADU|nr:spindle pole body component 110 isoform X2 [Arachis hypogaea]XP_052108549.1 spindle pole body component 110 isoform X2 [Arachis duranensis]
MEEYLLCMKTLRSQMNDVEDQAAKISVEEETQLTNVRTMEKDIESVKSEVKRTKEDTEQMKKVMGELCSKILENQKKIASSESDISKLTQTLELIHQEKVGLSAKLSEKRAYYTKVEEDLSAKLQKQQEWHRTKMTSRKLKEHEIKEKVDLQKSKTKGKAAADGNCIMDNLGSDARKSIITKLDSAKGRLNEILNLKSKMLMENNKLELKAADITVLQEEYNALMSDKAGEIEYLQSLGKQVDKLKEIHHVVKCACGEEFTVAVNM